MSLIVIAYGIIHLLAIFVFNWHHLISSSYSHYVAELGLISVVDFLLHVFFTATHFIAKS